MIKLSDVKALVSHDFFSQLLRYGLSGVGLTLLFSAIYIATIEQIGLPPLVANCAAFAVTVVVGYLVHSRWSFRGHGARDAPVRSTSRFLMVNLMGFALNSFWVWLIAVRLGLSPRLPLVPIVFVTPWISFWLNRRWTFGT